MSPSPSHPHSPVSPAGDAGGATSATGLRDALAAARTQHGESLLALSQRTPVLLVFLRHFG